MTTVFIGGSRAVSRLNPLIRAKLDELMSRHCAIFIGDANGAYSGDVDRPFRRDVDNDSGRCR